jgi:plastocyanin
VTHEPGVDDEYTVGEPGSYRYACLPHQSLGATAGIVAV